MSLNLKFNIVLIIVFSIGMLAAGLISSRILHKNVEIEIQHMAEIIMENAQAVRSYTIEEIRPLLKPLMDKEFHPQSVPAYAASQNIERVRERFPEYTYKEATINPINPNSQATDWETSIIEHFRNHPEETELIGINEKSMKPYLYVAHPITVNSANCLACHGNTSDAPWPMLDHYKPKGGFGWKLGEIVGMQIVSVPIDIALERSSEALQVFLISLGLVFLAVLALLNILLYFMVIKPVTHMSKVANEISMGNADAPEFDISGNNEFKTLGKSFNRMRRSLNQAMKMIEDDDK
jgi:HAMP domain-containing protein